MPVDKTYSDTQGQSPNQSHEKFEWHILLTEKSITEKNVTEQEKCTAISVLESYSHGQNISLSKAELKQAISKGALWLTPAKNKKQTQRLRRVKNSC
jgi:tRNA pseudouridine32 synthase/23S rRNA pseudouridine746 synthase